MHRCCFPAACAALAAASLAPLASAHVSLEPRTATAGTYQKLVFRAGHGCEGSATTALTVTVPEGLGDAKAMPKPGWTLTTGGRDISWKGGPLPDSQFDEFSLLMKLPDTSGRQVFKVVQQCERGRAEWSEAPGAGGKFPAPVLEIVAPGAGAVLPAMPAMPGMPAGHHH